MAVGQYPIPIVDIPQLEQMVNVDPQAGDIEAAPADTGSRESNHMVVGQFIYY